MDVNENRQGQAGGQPKGTLGEASSGCRIIPFRPRVNPRPAPAPEGFDISRSHQLDLLIHVIDELRAEKRRLESFIPARETTA